MSDLEWGVVMVTAGQHKGRLGYYDDDDTDRTAIVYFGTPNLTPYVLIQKRYLRMAVEGEARLFAMEHMTELAYRRAAKRLQEGVR